MIEVDDGIVDADQPRVLIWQVQGVEHLRDGGAGRQGQRRAGVTLVGRDVAAEVAVRCHMNAHHEGRACMNEHRPA